MKSEVISGVHFYYVKKSQRGESPQQYAINIAKECGNQVIVKHGNYSFGSVYNYDQLAQLIDRTHYRDRIFYELVTGRQNCFADIDGEFAFLEHKTPEPYFKSVYHFMERNLPDFDPEQLFILDSSTDKKLSLHINYLGVVFENCDHQKPFWQDAIRFFEEHDEHRHMGVIQKRKDDKYDRKSVVDVAVYGKNRAMRTIHCHKKDSDRVLKPVQWTDSGKLVEITNAKTSNYFCGTTEPSNFLYNPQYEHSSNKLLTKADICKVIEDNIPHAKLKETKGALFILENVGTRKCILGGEDNASDNCYLIWKKSGLYFGCHDEGCHGKQLQLIKNDSKMVLCEPDFLCPEHWASIDDTDYKAKIDYFQKHMSYIWEINAYCWKINGQYKIGTSEKAKAAFVHFRVSFEDDDGKIEDKQIFPMWNSMINKTSYKSLEWFPWTVEKPKGGSTSLNTFLGFNHTYDPEFGVDETKIKPWLFHLENVICDHDVSVYEYLLNWLAHVVQRPDRKIGVNIVAKSVLEGAGKDTFLNFFTTHVLGSQFSRSFNKIDDLMKKFNSDSERSVITLLSEVGGNGAAYKNHNTLKDITTREYQNIERKGIDGYRAKDYNNYWMFSNDDWIVKINESDRRHLCISCDTKYVGDEDYFNNLYKYSSLKCGEHFFQYLCQRDISLFSPRNIPHTEWARAMKCKNYDAKFRVLRGLYWTAKNSPHECLRIHSSDVMGMVNQFNSKSNQYTSVRSFNCDWVKYARWAITSPRINNIQKKGYRVTADEILETARKIQRDDTFEFEDYQDEEMEDTPDMTKVQL